MFIKGKKRLNEDTSSNTKVYLGEDSIGREVIIKEDCSERNLLEQEAKTLTALNKGNIRCPQMYEFVKKYKDKPTTIYMEYVRGKTLDKYIEIATLKEKLKVILDVACIIYSMNGIGYKHCDLKPQNIIIPNESKDYSIINVDDQYFKCNAKVIDFDISRAYGRQGFHTKNYASFEQRANLALGNETDVQSLAIMMYEILFNEIPQLAINFSNTNWSDRTKIAFPDNKYSILAKEHSSSNEDSIKKNIYTLEKLYLESMIADREKRIKINVFIKNLNKVTQKLK